ncbi:MAG TPA: universal stress protein [Rhizomicrobium sp.]|nr:universal stress protein [Rhizomicrobium sp.]
MSIAKIIAPLTGSKRDKRVLSAAFAAAKPFSAHVVGLFVCPDPRLSMPYIGVQISPDVVQDIIDGAAKINAEAAKTARATLAEAASAAGVSVVTRPEKNARETTCSFVHMEGYFPACVAEAAKFSDLVVFGPILANDSPDISEAFAEILVKTERPVLLATLAPKDFPGKVAIAWDGSDTAARAIIGAMPVLEKAGEIILLSCCRDPKKKADFRNVEQYLALHGIACNEATVDPGTRETGAALLEAAKMRGADLLVMGGYGHSHLGELIFGGVTQHVRWHATMPVLMIH